MDLLEPISGGQGGRPDGANEGYQRRTHGNGLLQLIDSEGLLKVTPTAAFQNG